MLNSYAHSVTKGTADNRLRQAKVYLGFAVVYKVVFLSPSITHTAMFAQYLGNSFASPASVKNYFYGAKLWVFQHGGNTQSFLSSLVAEVIKGIEKFSQHIPAPAFPITVIELKIICQFFDQFSIPMFPYKAALLIGFACFLRASNLLPMSLNSWHGSHALLARDVILVPHGLLVVIRSTKTVSNKKSFSLQVFEAPGSPLCPVKAWKNYRSHFSPSPNGPAFIVNAGVPLTPAPLVKLIRLALSSAGYQQLHRFSLHSLRRGAAQLAAELGASKTDLKNHGSWASDSGLKSYVNISSTVPRLLASNLPS